MSLQIVNRMFGCLAPESEMFMLASDDARVDRIYRLLKNTWDLWAISGENIKPQVSTILQLITIFELTPDQIEAFKGTTEVPGIKGPDGMIVRVIRTKPRELFNIFRQIAVLLREIRGILQPVGAPPIANPTGFVLNVPPPAQPFQFNKYMKHNSQQSEITGVNKYESKYLKYKTKYLNLKNYMK